MHDAGCRIRTEAQGMVGSPEACEGELMCRGRHQGGHRESEAGGTANSITGAVTAIVVLIILLRACS
jgi:hypothetical protein